MNMTICIIRKPMGILYKQCVDEGIIAELTKGNAKANKGS